MSLCVATQHNANRNGDEYGDGGGIYNGGGTVTLNGGEISHNHANGDGSDGGGIYNEGLNAKVTLNGNASIKGNTAWRGGGVSSWREVDLYGGEITENQASAGGGIFMYEGELKVKGQEITKEVAASAFVHRNTADADHSTDNIRFS